MERKDQIMHRLQYQHLSIAWVTTSLSSERKLLKTAPKKWNIHELVAHLSRYQTVFIDRIKEILNEEQPLIQRYKAEEDPAFDEWRNKNTSDLLLRLNADRQVIINQVMHLSEAQLKRTGVHTKYGEMNILEWVDFFLLHEAHHCFVIFQLAHDTDLH
ncbi:MAG: DinB family protein [Chitinophagaceae bacterium]